MKIVINGQEKELDDSATLHDVIAYYCEDASRVIAEVNGHIVRNPLWSATTVYDGDKIELVNFVGGG